MLEYLEFMIWGFGDLGVKISIHVENEKLVCNGGSPFWDHEQFETVRLSKKKSVDFFERIKELHINRWKASYSPIGYIVMDGTQWELEYKEMGKRCRHITGDNAYPDNWNAFMGLLDDILPSAGLIDENQTDSLKIDYLYEYEIDNPFEKKKKCKCSNRESFAVDALKQNVSYLKECNDGTRQYQECHYSNSADRIFGIVDEYVDMFDAMADAERMESIPLVTIEYKKHAFPSRKVVIPYCRWTVTENWNDFVNEAADELKNVITPGEIFSKDWYTFGKRENELIYLSVEFQAGGRTYYYKTEDDTIRPGDEVFVPVGNDGERKKVRVKKIEYYLPNNAPFPEDKTRAVISRADKSETEEYQTDPNDSDWLNDLSTVSAEDDEELIDDNREVISICQRKGVNLIQVKNQVGEIVEYIFTIMTEWLEDIDCDQREFDSLCSLFSVSKDDYIAGWEHFFEWESVYLFIKGYELVRETNGYYYAYGYVAEEKSADAVYRYKDCKFERYYPKEGIWREAPEERIILKERKARYTHLKEEEAMSLSLLV